MCAHEHLFSPLSLVSVVLLASQFKDFKSHNLISANGVSRLCVDPDINKL